MPLNISDAENAFLAGKANVEKWAAQFQEEWYSPLRETMLAMLWESLPPAEHQELAKMNPQAYARVSEQIKKIKTRR